MIETIYNDDWNPKGKVVKYGSVKFTNLLVEIWLEKVTFMKWDLIFLDLKSLLNRFWLIFM